MNSNSFDSFLPKAEVDVDVNRIPRLSWNSEMTMKLIETLESECEVLWNTRHTLYKDKTARQSKMEYLADVFGTTTEEISRKIHNLRSQYNHELRKMKKRQEAGFERMSSGWDYFEALSFLKSSNAAMNDSMMSSTDPLETSPEVETVNIALAEFQAEEEQEFAAARRCSSPAASTSDSPGRKKPTLRVAASAPPPLPPGSLPIMWREQPRIQPIRNADECQIFGDFVASELRTLRPDARKKMKRLIQRVILQVAEEEDVNNRY